MTADLAYMYEHQRPVASKGMLMLTLRQLDQSECEVYERLGCITFWCDRWLGPPVSKGVRLDLGDRLTTATA